MGDKDSWRDLLVCIGGALIAIAGSGLSAYFLHGHAMVAVLVACLVVGLILVGIGVADMTRRKRTGGRYTAPKPALPADPSIPPVPSAAPSAAPGQTPRSQMRNVIIEDCGATGWVNVGPMPDIDGLTIRRTGEEAFISIDPSRPMEPPANPPRLEDPPV